MDFACQQKMRECLSQNVESVPGPKPGFHSKKSLLYIRWNVKDVVSVMVHVTTLTADVYQQILNRIKGLLRQKFSALVNKKKDFILQSDNLRRHSAGQTQYK